jgi:hypothetical protein
MSAKRRPLIRCYPMKVLLIIMASAIVICICICICGCVLPIPSRSTIMLGLNGCIVESSTRTPVSGVCVEEVVAPDMIRHVVSADDGSFKFAPVRQQHWCRYFGCALSYPLPYPKRTLFQPVPLRFSHPDYQSRELLILTPDWPHPAQLMPDSQRAVVVSNQYLELGIVELAPKPCSQETK